MAGPAGYGVAAVAVIKDDVTDFPDANGSTPTQPPDRTRKSARATTGGWEWATCGGCTTRWRGISRCHCGACHETFTSITGFDMHRKAGRCVPPAAAGLIQRSDDLWRKDEWQRSGLWGDAQ